MEETQKEASQMANIAKECPEHLEAANDCWKNRQYVQCKRFLANSRLDSIKIEPALREWILIFNRCACDLKLARCIRDYSDVKRELVQLLTVLQGVHQTSAVICLDVLITHNLLVCVVQQQMFAKLLLSSEEITALTTDCLKRVAEYLGCAVLRKCDVNHTEVDAIYSDVLDAIERKSEPVLHFVAFILMLNSCVHTLCSGHAATGLKILNACQSCLRDQSIFLPCTLQPSEYQINVLLNDSHKSTLTDQHQQFGDIIERMRAVFCIATIDYCGFVENLEENEALANLKEIKYAHATVLYRQELISKCLECCSRTKDDVNEDCQAKWYNLLACCIAHQGKIHHAIQLFAEALRKENAGVLPLYNLSLCYRRVKNASAEVECLELLVNTLSSAMSIKPNDDLLLCDSAVFMNSVAYPYIGLPLAVFVLAVRCRELGRFRQAVATFIRLLKLYETSSGSTSLPYCITSVQLPPITRVYLNLAYCQLQCGHYADSSVTSEKLSTALEAFSVNEIVERQDMLDTSLLSSENENKKRKSSVSTLSSGQLLQQCHCCLLQSDAAAHLNDHKTALKCINNAINICNQLLQITGDVTEPKSKVQCTGDDAKNKLTCHHSGQNQQVLSLLKDSYTNKANILVAMDESEAAVGVSRLALQLEPKCETALFNHSLILLKNRRWKDACHTWLRHRSITPNRVTLADTLQSTRAKLTEYEASASNDVTGVGDADDSHLTSLTELEKLRLDVYLLQTLQQKTA